MRKLFIFIVVMACTASLAFAANFTPTLLKISAPSTVLYNFDGKTLNIPVTITGTQANLIFTVFTKDKASTISKVKNGYLGWHYVNKIDTCVYVSGIYGFDKGTNAVIWDGKGDDKVSLVPAGEYTYYMWGYDGVGLKTMVTNYITWDHSTHSTFVTHDVNGTAKAQPIFYKANGAMKLTIGSDPMDSTLIETTKTPGGRQFLVDPSNYNNFFIHTLDKTRGKVSKYEWVPNGTPTLINTWGTDSGISYFHSGTTLTAGGGMAIVGDQIIVGLYDRDSSDANSVLCFLDIATGELNKKIDLSDRWFHLDDRTAGAQSGGGPGQVFQKNNMVFLSTFNACYREMIDPANEDEKEFVLWGNGNGDYVGDHNFEPTAAKPWVCFDYNVSPYAYTTHADANLFSTFGAYDMGAVSFGLIAPDGTGIGYFALAGETAKFKQGNLFVDYDSAYDGIYTDNASAGATVTGKGMWFIGHDSVKGIISNQVGVKDAAPAAFSVAQNTPNPFNPATTINFSIAKAGKVTVDVFNSAGQKVDTIVNSQMTAGSHSVNWNAAKFSAGVYFCTVKSGSFSKTVKMTFLK